MFKEGSIGVPFPDTYIKIVEPGTDQEVPYGTEGEILLAGPTVMKEYMKHPDETAQTLRRHADGLTWVYTGDLGTMDSEGFVYFRGRAKRMIVSSGYNVYPGQIENILDANEMVQMSCVIGIPDAYRMQKVKAFVKLAAGIPANDATRQALMSYCAKHIAKYAMPCDIEFRDELPKHFPPRYFAMKLLERDKEVEAQLADCPHFAEWIALRDRAVPQVEEELGEDVETALANQKYGFISGALKETFTPGGKEQAQTTHIIDAFVTHKLWGFPIFFFLMWLMFYCTFNIGAYPQEWIETLVGWIGSGLQQAMPDGAFKDLLIDGVIGGVGSVIVFLPNIIILYLFISFMEDSGYLARAAFIMDRVMHRIGLHGKSFIPLVMGFGCNVPAIMATRTIESRSSRLITVLITPFLSCSARLPIYILFVGTFFPDHGGLVLFGLYLLGIALAVVTARLMRRFLYKVDETPFVMELPPYRMPTMRATLSHMWDKSAQYLRKMGGLILVASLFVWFLSYFPRPVAGEPEIEHYENSYLGQLGRWCEPAVEPLGLNWKAGVAILSGVSAKEIVVSTLGVLYSQDATADDASLAQTLRESGDFTPASALAFLVFVLLYFPCIATIVAVRNEAGRGWALASMVYSTAVAWFVAWIVYHIALLL